LLHQPVEVDAHEGQLEFPGFDLGQIEQIVEQRDQMRAGGVNVLEILRLLCSLWTNNQGKLNTNTRSRQSLLAGLPASSAHIDRDGRDRNQTEEIMFKHLSICAAFIALGTGALGAQPQEAVLQTVELPGANYSMVVALPKSRASAIIDLRGVPDPTVAYIAGGALVLGIDDTVEKTIKDIGALLHPSCTFHADGIGSNSPKTVTVFIVSKGETPVARRQESALQSLSPGLPPILSAVARRQDAALKSQTLTMSLIRMKPSGAGFDILFGITKFPDTGKLAFKYDGEDDKMFTTIVPMLIPSCVTHVEHDDGTADVITIYVVPKADQLGPLMQ
jgi:hypothetical protein